MRRRHESGLTMIELMVTMAVTLIGLVGLMSMYVSSVRGERGASEIAEATSIAENTLETLRKNTIDELTSMVGGTLPGEAELGIVSGGRGVDYRQHLAVEEVSADGDLVRVRVAVGWSEHGAAEGGDHDRQVELELVRTRLEIL